MSIPLLIEVQKFSRYFYLLTNYDGFYFLAFLFVIIFVIYQEAFGNMITIWAFVILGLVFANLVSTQPINFILSDYIVDRTFFVSIPTTSQSQNCSMKLKIDSKKADVDLSCIKNAAPYKIIFNVSEQIENQSYDIHSFKLEGISQTHSVGVINVTVSTVAQWNYFLKIKLNQTGVIILTGNFTQDQFLIADFIFFYSVLSIIVLPPFLQYHWNIVGYSLLTMMSSQLLMFSVLSNSFVALWKYKDHILTSSLYVFLLILSCLIQLVQFYFKVRILIKNVYLNYSSNRSRILIISLFYAILIALSILYYRVHKDVTTYCAFAATLFYYMSSFLIVPKNSRAYFSFRGVLLDGISIVFLTLMSRIYPIMHYKIATFYTMMGSFLIFWVILLYSVTIFILINIVKRDSNKTSFNQSQILSLQSFSGAQNKCDWKQDDEQNKEKGRQMKIEEQREEIQKEKQQQSEDSQKKWKKIKQLSMMSQIVNSSNIISRNQDQIKDTVQI